MFFSYDDLLIRNCNKYEYLILILLAIIAMFIAVSSYNLLSIYVAIELQSICFYVLAAFKRSNLYSSEAGLRYFILGAFSSNFLLFGFSILYVYMSIISFDEFALFLSSFEYDLVSIPLGFHIGLVFILVALLFKFSASPFHMWVPDVYEGSPMSTTSFFIILPKLVIFVLFIRFYYNIFHILFENIKILLTFSAISSIVVGTFGALEQTKIKRFLAYSTISNIGYLLIGITVCTSEGVQASFIYLIIYIVMSINLFSMITSIHYLYHEKFKFITDLRNLNELYITNLSKKAIK